MNEWNPFRFVFNWKIKFYHTSQLSSSLLTGSKFEIAHHTKCYQNYNFRNNMIDRNATSTVNQLNTFECMSRWFASPYFKSKTIHTVCTSYFFPHIWQLMISIKNSIHIFECTCVFVLICYGHTFNCQKLR